MNQIYLDTARLLTQVAPLVFVDDTFALKGGTAINLFVRDMPRLSVDLDLVFPDHTLSRDKAPARIKAALRQAADRLKKRGFQTHASAAGARETKLLVRRGRIEIKVEVNFVMRGTVQPVRRASLTPTARDVLMADLDIPVVSLEDMYGGKVGRRTGSSAPARPLRRDAALHALLAAREPRGGAARSPSVRQDYARTAACWYLEEHLLRSGKSCRPGPPVRAQDGA